MSGPSVSKIQPDRREKFARQSSSNPLADYTFKKPSNAKACSMQALGDKIICQSSSSSKRKRSFIFTKHFLIFYN